MKANDLTKFKKVFNEIQEAKKHAINIGLPKDVGIYPDGQSIVEVGERHEFGLGVTRRSFLRMPLIMNQETINKHLKDSWKQIVEGKSTAIKQFNILGIVGQNISRDAFKTQGYGNWKDIDEKTKKAKKSSKILFNKGILVGSVTNWISKN